MRLLSAIALFTATLLQAQASATATAEIPFEYREGLIWIQAMFGTTNQLNLLLDSGASASVINRGTADRLRLNSGVAVNVRGVSTTLPGYKLKAVPARAGETPLPADYISVDLSSLSHSCAQPVDGLLGADFFRGRAIQIDFKARKLRLLTGAPDPRSSDTVPLLVRPCGILLPITVNGHKQQWVRLDTGCATALQWVTSSAKPTDCNPKVAIGLAEMSIPQTRTSVEIAGQRFDDIPTGIHDKPIFTGEAGLLGNGLLSRFSRVTIDARSRRLILEP